MSFVHLHVHSEYSLLESSVKLKSLVKKAKEHEMPALALTDNGNMFGAIEFYFAAKDQGLNPILGCDFYLAPGSRFDKKQGVRDLMGTNLSKIVCLASSFKGYQNLSELTTLGYHEGFYYKPRIDYEILARFNEDLIILSGGVRGDIAQTFFKEGADEALKKVRHLKEIFSDRFYLEMVRTGQKRDEEMNNFLMETSRITGVSLVAANDVHYLTRDDQMAQEVLICIGSNRTLQDESRFRLGSDQFYFKSPAEMRALFADQLEACDRTLEIAKRCDIKFKLKDELGKSIYHLPSFPTQDGASLKEEIHRLSLEGLARRFRESLDLKNEKEVVVEVPEAYLKRLDYELSIIDRMGFNGYFLIVQDFINWAKSQGIPVGPGRGSGAGSLVAYSLRITDLDPIPNGLLFERFLNPERISMPDFDIDFCQDRRGEVIDYVIQKYGKASVSQIITYGKLQTRAAIKDVGRVLGMTFSEVDQVSKLIPEKLGITLKEALEMEPRIKELMDSNPQVATLIELAQRVEGLVRHAGIHAAGVIIADGELVRHAPLSRGADGESIVQYDMKHAEKVGLIKFDFLGLKTLTHINNALKLIEKNRKKKIRVEDIPMNDEKVFAMLSAGDTLGVFQFEGEGITDATRKIKPSSFADITAITSLYRPGPMANIPDYTKRKHGEALIEYLIADTKEVLEETYGIMVYQEQVMAIASRIAGYSLGEADMLRRAMGKKIKEEMDRHRVRFLDGAKKLGHDEKKADELFDLMYKFADYGFNKSHAAAYSVITLQTAWLKCHYPAEFFAALLSTEMNDTDKVVKYAKDAKNHGLLVKPPHVNYSEYAFNVVGDTIYYGLGAIKGVGQAAAELILKARDSGELTNNKFASLEEFFSTVDPKALNKKVIESLIKAGAFDNFGYHRAELLNGFSRFIDFAAIKRQEAEIGQASLFSLLEDEGEDLNRVVLDQLPPWSRNVSLNFEKEVLGFFLSDHPLNGFNKVCSNWISCHLNELLSYHARMPKPEALPAPPAGRRGRDFNKLRVTLAVIVVELKELITKKGTRMAFLKLEDLTGQAEAVVFPDVYNKLEMLLKEERPLLVNGFLEVDETGEAAKIILAEAMTLQEAMKKSKAVVLSLKDFSEEDMHKLLAIIESHPGEAPVHIELSLPELNKTVSIKTQKEIKVDPSPDWFESLHQNFGQSSFVDLKVMKEI